MFGREPVAACEPRGYGLDVQGDRRRFARHGTWPRPEGIEQGKRIRRHLSLELHRRDGNGSAGLRVYGVFAFHHAVELAVDLRLVVLVFIQAFDHGAAVGYLRFIQAGIRSGYGAIKPQRVDDLGLYVRVSGGDLGLDMDVRIVSLLSLRCGRLRDLHGGRRTVIGAEGDGRNGQRAAVARQHGHRPGLGTLNLVVDDGEAAVLAGGQYLEILAQRREIGVAVYRPVGSEGDLERFVHTYRVAIRGHTDDGAGLRTPGQRQQGGTQYPAQYGAGCDRFFQGCYHVCSSLSGRFLSRC